jgi:hypothetical protein
MSRNDLTREELAELAALDEILGGKPVADDHLELAALVDSVRSVSPRLDAAGRARLDARLARRRPSARPRRRAGLPSPAWAGGSLAAVLIAAAAVIGSGALNSNGTHHTLAPAIHRAIPFGRPDHTKPAGGIGTPANGSTSAPATGSSESGVAPGAATVTPGSAKVPNTNPAHRLVARGASLTLASPPNQMQGVANEVVADTEHFGGIVESSSVNVHGSSSYSSFSLSVPSTRLGSLISSLSSLAGVRSLEQSTNDITDSYDQASNQLGAARAQRAALIKALAAATSLAQEQAIQAKVDRLDTEIAAAERRVGGLLSRGHNASVAVQIVASSAAAALGGSGPLNRALNDALRVLDVALAIGLVALALAIPFGLVGFGLWWSSTTVRRHARERVLAGPPARP